MKLFTTNWHRLFFITYILLFVWQSQLIKLFHVDTKITSNLMMETIHPTTIVLATELLKLLLAIIIFVKDNNFESIIPELIGHLRLFLLSCIPAILYCVVNNLQFINMSHYDPVTYSVWMQCRLIATGFVYQFIFQRYLNQIQWLSLMLLTIGCIIKQFDRIDWSIISLFNGIRTFEFVNLPDRYIALIIVQIFCSTIGGVYNEYLIKKSQEKVHLMMQNIYNYILSIVFNLIFLFITIPNHKERWQIMNVIVFDDNQKNFWFFVMIINNALCGLAASLFLDKFNSIMKVFATGCHLILVALASYWLLNTEVNIFTFISIIIVSISIYLYVKNPVISIISMDNKKIRAN
ncbi:UDP-galactose transporter senju [Dermatophagoides pteronyssinus]|uniref:UDP-galactose transporter senju-like n=2 Tax=Dermatophagoides pteronyssinus TaxID=6956 RepID=A0A6P6XTG2_DERPT|nr:UDP-galactose transporter senju-like [Dermatophagoides pteronyssinus]KAH9420121.1 hypothetical protein DERP_001956 [Dermatophagoides pteronyssinus]